jgi:hypothetical protein
MTFILLLRLDMVTDLFNRLVSCVLLALSQHGAQLTYSRHIEHATQSASALDTPRQNLTRARASASTAVYQNTSR